MKKIWILTLVAILMVSMLLMGTSCKAAEEPAAEEPAKEEPAAEEPAAEEVTEEKEPVTITISSWRTEDQERIDKINDIYEEQHPNVTIEFNPIRRDEYEAKVLVDLEGGVGPDIVVLYGYDRGKPPYEAGYLLTLNDWLESDVPSILELPDSAISAWRDDEGNIYGIPLLGVSNGFFYNKDILDKYEFEEPTFWDEFINICDTLLENNVTPIACGAKTNYLLANHGFHAYGPNFYGGEKTRQKLISGEMKFTDEPIVKALTVMQSLVKYFPPGYEAIDYETSQQLFMAGQAAFFIGGSWEISTFEDIGYDFELGWFPGPVENDGDQLSFVFYPDQGWSINKDSKHIEEVKEYLKWVASCEFSLKFAEELPGFFPFAKCDYQVTNPISQEILSVLNDPNVEITTRLYEEKLSSKEPSARSLMYDVSPQIVLGEITPEEAAQYIQKNLETWYEPYQ